MIAKKSVPLAVCRNAVDLKFVAILICLKDLAVGSQSAFKTAAGSCSYPVGSFLIPLIL